MDWTLNSVAPLPQVCLFFIFLQCINFWIYNSYKTTKHLQDDYVSSRNLWPVFLAWSCGIWWKFPGNKQANHAHACELLGIPNSETGDILTLLGFVWERVLSQIAQHPFEIMSTSCGPTFMLNVIQLQDGEVANEPGHLHKQGFGCEQLSWSHS